MFIKFPQEIEFREAEVSQKFIKFRHFLPIQKCRQRPKKTCNAFQGVRPRQSSTSSTASSIWDEVRASESRKRKEKGTKKKPDKVPIMVPAGVDTGKFLERQLRDIESSTIGPKRLVPKTV